MQTIPPRGHEGLDHRSAARFLLALTGRQKSATLWGGLTAATWMTTTAVIPAAIGRAIDEGIVGNDTSDLIKWASVTIILGFVRALTGISFIRQSITTRVVSGALTLRAVTQHVTRLGTSLHQQQRTEEVLATATADISAIGIGLGYAGRIIGSVTAIAAVTLVMLTISLPLGLIVLATVPLLMGISSLLLRPLHRRQEAYRTLQADLAGDAIDIASGLRVLRGIGGERRFASRFREGSTKLRVADADVAGAEADVEGARILVPGLITIIVTCTAALFAVDAQLTVGEVVTFYGLAASLLQPITDFMDGTSMMTRAFVAAGRVSRLLSLPHRNLHAVATTAPEHQKVVTTSPGLLDDTSGLAIRPHTFVTVVSTDGTAQAERLARLDEPTSVTLDGTALTNLPPSTVRSRILLARNEDRFFTGTLREEIDPVGGASDEEILQALRLACATDVIDALPEGLDTRTTGRGRTLSGGQLQRLRLARAHLRQADYTILVEPTNAVDSSTEYRIAQNLAEHNRAHEAPGALVVFSTSPHLLHSADEVIFMHNDRVIAVGKHDELTEHQPAYAALVAREKAVASP